MSETNSSSSQPSQDRPPRERRVLVLTICLLIAAMFVGMVGVLYYHWRVKKVPTSVIAIVGRKMHEGTTVWVELAGRRVTRQVKLDAAGKYECQFFLQPLDGSYSVRLEHADGTPYGYYEVNQLKAYQRGVIYLPAAMLVVHGGAGDFGSVVSVLNSRSPIAPPVRLEDGRRTYRAAIDPGRGDLRLRIERPDGTVRIVPLKPLSEDQVLDFELSPGAATAPSASP